MKKYLISFYTIFFLVNAGYSQRDSVHSLFHANPHIRIPIKYSYLQWDLGYTNFLFNNQSLSGYSLDLIGIVFNNDWDIAAGFEGAGNHYGYVPIGTVSNYSAFYLKFVPMLFPEKLINFSMPLKFAYSNLSVSNSNNPGGYRRGRGRGNPGYSFFSFTPGADIFLNIFHFLSLGAGVNYRFAFSTPGSFAADDYNNFSFSGIVRLKLYPHKKINRLPDYYAPPQQRPQQ
jgi:hypothetical protein